jgi:hypothetical protein
MSSRSRRRKAASTPVRAPLGEAEEQFLRRLGDVAEAVAGLATALQDGADDEQVGEAEERLEAARTAASHTGDIDILAILSSGRPETSVLMAVVAEREALGRPVMMTDGDPVVTADDDGYSPIAEIMDDILSMPFSDRVDAAAEDATAAALLAGVHVARSGDNDVFFLDPWQTDVLPECMAAAGITGAVLALARSRAACADGAHGDEPCPGADDASLSESLLAAAMASAAGAGGIHMLSSGFSTESLVVERLLASDRDLDIDPCDAHRVSGYLVEAFLAGLDRTPFSIAEDDRDDGVVEGLLRTAEELGTEWADGSDGYDDDDDAALLELPPVPVSPVRERPLLH